ncbi:MAG: DUF1326 domain-containing protein [Candidatus Hydrogenedentes bacterium]|nr:DUF1326 domain-containing protein [Candidatus Hydrogenedentota bacterium]
MNRLGLAVAALAVAGAGWVGAGIPATPSITGNYLEVRSCDVYTAACFANGEMGVTGKEAMMVWNVAEGAWNGVSLDGLSVIAVVRTPDTMGNVELVPQDGRGMLLMDAQATPEQRAALRDMAKHYAGHLLTEIVSEVPVPVEASMATCTKAGCASVKAGDIVEITTRCLGEGDHICGHETPFYPPLTDVNGAYPVATSYASFADASLDLSWQTVETRGAFLATFAN